MEELKNNDLIYLSSGDMRPKAPFINGTSRSQDEEIKQSDSRISFSEISFSGQIDPQPCRLEDQEDAAIQEYEESIKI